jgi:hypothetical protein
VKVAFCPKNVLRDCASLVDGSWEDVGPDKERRGRIRPTHLRQAKPSRSGHCIRRDITDSRSGHVLRILDAEVSLERVDCSGTTARVASHAGTEEE